MALTPEQEAGAQMGGFLKNLIGGRHNRPLTTAKSTFNVDVTQVTKLNEELKKTVETANQLVSALQKVQVPGKGGQAGSVSGYMGYIKHPQTTIKKPGSLGGGTPTDSNQGGGDDTAATASAFGGRKGMFAFFGGMQMVQAGMQGLDNRISRGANYALTTDRYNVVMQQQYGLSQNQVMNQMRKPLANYRLGPDGINAMMGFQMQTGYTATPQLANSLAGVRAITGYSKTGQDVVNDQMTMMDPTIANRQFMMLGVNAYTTGGGLNDPIKMRQQMVKAMGLTNEAALKGAKGPGSVTRARMADAGISGEMQDEILAYAQSNLTYQKKGGAGMYDPSKKGDRRRMGIEDNYATQAEETERARQQRDENFTRRQLDNYADMEKNTQEMVKILGSIEDKLSAVVGNRVSQGGWQKWAGSALKIGGAIASFVPGPTAVAGMGAMALGAMLSGDPTGNEGGGGTTTTRKSGNANDDNIMIPVGYGGKRQSLSAVKQRGDFKKLNPKMQDRLLSMFRDNPNVGIGGGSRDSDQQKAMFLSRYRRTSKKTDIEWDGSYWEHVSGAAAAPPGRSMHEIGLAADLVGDLKWMNANAGKYGLKHFAGVNNEPWHVQPAELPNSRRQYEKSGASWGTDGAWGGAVDAVNNAVNKDIPVEAEHGNHGGGGFGMLRDFTGMSISEIMAAMEEGGSAAFSAGQAGGKETAPKKPGTNTIGDTPIAGVLSPNTGGALAGVDVARAAFAAGFRGDDLVKMIAIAKRESGWRPRAYNGNLGTGDQSYGLWQLNTLNSKKGGMMGDLVNSILGKPAGNKDFNELFDPNVNARVAFEFYKRNGNTLRPWGGYKGVSDTHNADQYLTAAQQAVTAAQLGDPYSGEPPARMSGSGSMNVTSSPTYNINVAPVITFTGTPQTPDLRNIAQELTGMIEQNVRSLEMRSA